MKSVIDFSHDEQMKQRLENAGLDPVLVTHTYETSVQLREMLASFSEPDNKLTMTALYKRYVNAADNNDS